MATDGLELAALASVAGIGRRTLAKMLTVRQQLDMPWENLWNDELLLKGTIGVTNKQYQSIRKSKREHIKADLEKRLDWGDFSLLMIGDPEYPPLLAASDAAPPVLFAKGALPSWRELLSPVAIVGTRNATGYGRRATETIVTELAIQQVPVVSGLMYGIDSIAHLAAVRANGTTVAVLGYGFDHCYPEDHQPVVEEVLARGGLLLTEYPPWQPARKGNFPARNSIVAGLSAAVVVVEAALGSGSLITAQCALDDNRAVCAVPGPFDNPYSEGVKSLLNQGAVLVTSAVDILAVTEQWQRPNRMWQPTKGRSAVLSSDNTFDDSDLASSICSVLAGGGVTLEQLCNQLNLPVAQILEEVTRLELSGRIGQADGRLTLRR